MLSNWNKNFATSRESILDAVVVLGWCRVVERFVLLYFYSTLFFSRASGVYKVECKRKKKERKNLRLMVDTRHSNYVLARFLVILALCFTSHDLELFFF